MGVILKVPSLVVLAACLHASGCSSTAEREPGYPVDRDVVAKIHAGEISFGGGDGASYDNAIAVLGANGSREGVLAEYAYLEQNLGAPERDWFRVRQILISHDGRMYDVIGVRRANGAVRDYYFDVNNFYGIDLAD